MNRRELLLGGVALASAAMVGNARAAEEEHDHHHDMGAHVHSANPYAALAVSASDCIQKGESCLSHCLMVLGEGDKDMAECAKSVNQMLAVCAALQQLANQNSKFVPKLAALALDICNQCEESCKKHAKEHEECKLCGESCAACAKECKKVAAV